MSEGNIILGAGVTGLAAGFVSGFPVYEAEEHPGGICSSYYMRLGDPRRYYDPPADDEAYRFEFGGGHWLWVPNNLSEIHKFITEFASLKKYNRKSAVFFPDMKFFVPYPLQYNLSYLPKNIRDRAIKEIFNGSKRTIITLADWLENNFGATLCDLFFFPFHDLYSAGLLNKLLAMISIKLRLTKS